MIAGMLINRDSRRFVMNTKAPLHTSTPVLASAFITGLVFAIGLGISGMTDTTKVLGFLTLNADWNPALMLVMGGAIAVHAIVYRFAVRRSSPLFTDAFSIPSRRDIDGRLIGGALLFGLGWGWEGCVQDLDWSRFFMVPLKYSSLLG